MTHAMTRIPYDYRDDGKISLVESYNLIVSKRGGRERRIKAGKWWLDRYTPVGEDAEIFEHMPYQGKRTVKRSSIIAIETNEVKYDIH